MLKILLIIILDVDSMTFLWYNINNRFFLFCKAKVYY